ncbi:rhomboid family-domain-containing protein [Neocallimastix sp. 'constans']|jgi:membrane associated rhomboid family serine protease
MSNIRRGTTFKTIQRSTTTTFKTIQRSATSAKKTINRAGTGAWHWINAEDTEVSKSRPVGISYFQRNDTIRKINAAESAENSKLGQSKTIGRRKTTRSNISTTIRRKPRPAEALPLYNNDNRFNENAYYTKLEDTDGLYGDNIKRPEAAASSSNKPTHKKDEINRVPTVLYDPEVRRQLEQMHPHKPYFMTVVTAIQVFLLIVGMILNMKNNGSPISPIKNNLMIGPDSTVLIHMGAKYSLCMKELYPSNSTFNCVNGIKGSVVDNNGNNYCTLSDFCGMGMKQGDEPKQWYRFITAIFLHAGVLHIVFNLLFQVRTGFDMERDYGSWRIGIIYIATGIFGFAFGGSNNKLPSVGCSGALYGLLGCLFLDLFQSWKLIINPWRELVKMLLVIISSFAVGLIHFIDNSAHVGGFISGILTGLIFIPTISFSKLDLKIKRGSMIASIFITTYAFFWVFRTFYSDDHPCKWCKYINCIDYKDWCANYE